MITKGIRQRSYRPANRETSSHLFAVGQVVRLRGSFGTFPAAAEVYRITGTLPPRGDSPQYRIRNEEERYERVTTQDNLELVSLSMQSDDAALLERTFGHDRGTAA